MYNLNRTRIFHEPSGGKFRMMKELREYIEKGYEIVFVSEDATTLINSGIKPCDENEDKEIIGKSLVKRIF